MTYLLVMGTQIEKINVRYAPFCGARVWPMALESVQASRR